jgi:hypothetical protein
MTYFWPGTSPLQPKQLSPVGSFLVYINALPYSLRFGLLFGGTTGKMIGKGVQLSCDIFARHRHTVASCQPARFETR